MQQRPLSSRGGIGLQTPVQVADRPITQQGLSGIRTGATGTRCEAFCMKLFQKDIHFLCVIQRDLNIEIFRWVFWLRYLYSCSGTYILPKIFEINVPKKSYLHKKVFCLSIINFVTKAYSLCALNHLIF